ncbi:MAG: hypothetical protein CL878_06475, partial [Dehalococcoidia bacterium]|nr:hypothetical protein [Dehalococcoidia bacterium]
LSDRRTAAGSASSDEPLPAARSTLDDFAEIRRLSESGMSMAEIAQRMHRGREEIRLVLGVAAGRERSDLSAATTDGAQEASA